MAQKNENLEEEIRLFRRLKMRLVGRVVRALDPLLVSVPGDLMFNTALTIGSQNLRAIVVGIFFRDGKPALFQPEPGFDRGKCVLATDLIRLAELALEHEQVYAVWLV